MDFLREMELFLFERVAESDKDMPIEVKLLIRSLLEAGCSLGSVINGLKKFTVRMCEEKGLDDEILSELLKNMNGGNENE